jgi:release factor glutamine methyltransferase
MTLSSSPSLSAVVAEGTRRLEAAGVPKADSGRDAALLARAVLGWDQTRWLAQCRDPASPEFTAAFAPVLARRAAREPIAYILGEREFYGRLFAVSRAVLVPRPETELVVDRARAWWSGRAHRDASTIVDVGTGSGCLAVTLALECPGAHVIATDVSADALTIAAANAARHGASEQIDFREAPLAAGLQGVADLIVANPPYVAERDRGSLPPDVRDYEPPEALYAGPDGLDVIRPLAPAALAALRPGGGFVMEIGAGQWAAVKRILEEAGFDGIRVHDDLAGIPRVVVAARP